MLGFLAKLVVQGIIESQNPAQLRTEPCLHFRPKKSLLVLLLRFVPSGVKDVKRAPRKVRAIGSPAMPKVCVHHHNSPRLASNENFIRVRGGRIGKHLLWQSARPVCARNAASGAVFGREIVEHPYGVADRKALFVRKSTDIYVKRLGRGGMRIRRTIVKAAQFEIGSKHV